MTDTANPAFVHGQRTLRAEELPDSGLHPTPVATLVTVAKAEVVEVEDAPRALVCAAVLDQEPSLFLFVPDGQAAHERESGIRTVLAHHLSSADSRALHPGLAALAAMATVADFGPAAYDEHSVLQGAL